MRPPQARPGVVASPNIWRWPALYEVENRAQDAGDAVFPVLAEVADWSGRDVVDIGCGSGFHLPRFAERARSVLGVEPHGPLRAAAARRTAELPHVEVGPGTAQHLPLADASVDVAHARTAYFFGPGCEPGIAEALRVLRPGGVLAVVDLDATAHAYGRWMRQDLPHYRPAEVEGFFAAQGFGLRRVETVWRFARREDLERVLRIEFSPQVARRAIGEAAGTELQVRYRVHWLRRGRLPLLLGGAP